MRFPSQFTPPGAVEALLLVLVILLRYIRGGFEKKRANCRRDIDGYRPVSFELNVRIYFRVFLWEHMQFTKSLVGD